METNEASRGHTDSETECDIKNPLQSFSLKSYLREEVLQSSRRRNEASTVQEQICGPFRNRVWKFLSIPQYFESFMFYGLLQCLDHILMVYTFLPLRCIITLFSLLTSSALGLLGLCVPSLGPRKLTLYATDARELVKFSFVCICTVFLYTFDSSIAYHEIRTQSVIKIYIFFNLLEVADRLLSAVYLDAIDDVLFTVSAGLSTLRRPRAPSAEGDTHASASDEAGSFGAFIVQYVFALVCLSAHCLLLLAQVTTLNVAFNSQNRSLLTVIISNNFVELKGNVFRKMGKSNLFQIACADVRERFHYTVWLFIIVCRNMSASGWQYEEFLALLPDILLIFLAEVAVDWIKHAFISKFNVIASDVYEEYTVSIAYDLLLCHQGKNTSDYFELLARRMGLTPISLSCLINVMIIQTVKSSWIYVFLLLALPLIFAFKVLVHIVLLNRAYTHVQAYTQMMTAKLAKETASTTAAAQSNTKASNLPSGKGAGEGDAPRRKTSIFYPPYTGYDQPTRDDYQLAMPQLPHRRTHSDSTCISMPHAAKEGIPKALQSYDLGDTAESIDEFSSLNSFPTNSGETPVRQRPPPPPQKGTLKVVGWPVEEVEVGEETDSRFRQFLLDADDMQICRRRNVVIPSLPSSPLETAMIEILNPDRSSPTPPATASTFFKSQPRNPLFNVDALYPVPVTSSRKSSPKRHLATQRRRCFSLDDPMLISPHQDRNQHPAAPDGTSTNVVGNDRNSPLFKRCRLHTENEISSSIILEQLNSVLNDETAHLEDAVDVDLLSNDEISALETEGVEESGTGDGEHDRARNASSSANACGTVTSADASIIDQVKQPLSNVDRYSMLGGQIS